MENEALPHQLTVKQLKRILEKAQDDAVVALRLPAGYIANPDFVTLINLLVEDKDPIVIFTPQETMR